MLADIANDPARERIAIADVRNAMGDRAFGALLFVFAAPNTLPVNAPGVSVVLGIPLLFLSLQLMLGFALPWLPRAVVEATVTRQSFARVMNVVVPWIRRAERLSEPRWPLLATGLAERLIGLVCAILSIVLILPVPFGNMGPGDRDLHPGLRPAGAGRQGHAGRPGDHDRGAGARLGGDPGHREGGILARPPLAGHLVRRQHGNATP